MLQCQPLLFTHQVCLNAWLSTVSIRIGFCKSIRCLLIHYPSSRHSNQRKKSNHQSSSSSEKQITRRWQPAPWYCQRTPWHNTLSCLPTSPIVCTLTIRAGFWVVKIYPPWKLTVCSWKRMKTGCIRKGSCTIFQGPAVKLQGWKTFSERIQQDFGIQGIHADSGISHIPA